MAQYFNASLKNLIHRLRAFDEILEKELANEILDKSFLIARALVAESQLGEGVDGSGTLLSNIRDYTKETKAKKVKKGTYTGKVNLNETGRFYNSLSVVVEPDGFRVISNEKPQKAGRLINLWGPKILMLSNEHLSEVLNQIRPSLAAKLKRYLELRRIEELAR